MTPRELETHLTDLFEGRLEAEPLEALQQELRANPEARIAYRDHARLQNVLEFRAAGNDPLQVIPMDHVIERRQQRILRTAGLAAVALLTVLGVVLALILTRTPPPNLTFTTSPGTEVAISHQLTGEEAPQGMVLEPGSRLEVFNGTVELEFNSGVRSIVRGPAVLTLQRDDLLDLARGTAWFRVPPKGVGFQVNTPDLTLTDLGTEFGILSQPELLDEVHVFEGKVEVLNRYGLKKQDLIEAGQARVAGPAGRWKETEVRKDYFLTTLPTAEPGDFKGAIVHDDFERDSSEDYICVDYYRGGKYPLRFSIDSDNNGVLEIAPLQGGGKGGQIVHRSATLEVGQTFRADWLTPAQSGYAIAQVLTDTIDGKRYAMRLRVNDGAYLIDFRHEHEGTGTTGTVEWHNRSSYTAPETFWVDRTSATEFIWYRGAKPAERIKIASITLDSPPGPLHVGVQAWATTAQFDNLAILPLVDPANTERLQPAPDEDDRED